ncbi:MAG: exopolyphosphatase/guanosine-5'-triphosphate,3'-diphosphate pyrophosphatase, partial [Lentisphaeria bacterium]
MNMPQFESPYFAAIDLGSNSFHMLIVRINETKIEIVDREKEMVQIARGLQPDGTLDAEARDRALQCLQRFSERLRDIPKRQVRAVGTKTLRTARQSRAFLKAAEKAIGVPIDIISGYEEARLVYAGLSNTVTSDGGHRLVIDIGGGSTELVIGKDCDPMVLESLPLGCVSFSERYILNSGGVTAKNMRRAYLAACSELENIRKIYLKKGWEIAYGTSGTMKAVAELLVEHDGGAVVRKAS